MRFGRPVSESCIAWYSFSACFAASFDVASCSECVRRNICRANASGAAKTTIASADVVRERGRDEDREQRQAHVRQHELAEDALVHVRG